MEPPLPPAPAERVLSTHDGHALTAWLHGAPQAPRALLLHGLSQQGRFWDPVIRRMRTRPVAALDQRGHGTSNLPPSADYSIPACAEDVITALDALEAERVVLVGHSWGASVALEAAVRRADRVASIVLIDGGAWTMPGDRAEARERLRPPALGMPAEELWDRIAASSPWFDAETRAALEPTFRVDDGAIRTRIGVDRHMAVLDGLLAYDVAAAWAELAVPAWVASCDPPGDPRDLTLVTDQPSGGGHDPALRRILRWEGAVHDVPLQWPALVAGLIDEACEGAA